MRAKAIFALLLKIAALFSITFVVCYDHSKHLPPNHPPITLDPDKDPKVIQSNCESNCARSGKHLLCGTDHCTYSGYIELNCVHGCGRPVTKWKEVKCTHDTPAPPKGWITVTKCVNKKIQ